MGAGSDPIAEIHAAHESAAALLHAGRAADDPAVTERLIALVDDIGISTLADLWADRPARSLPGALWRLYLLREWISHDPARVARDYAAGIRFTEPHNVVAGVGYPGPDEVQRAADEILRGVFDGDFAVALERAAAFCHVVSAGRADLARDTDEFERAGRLTGMAADLTACAHLWRLNQLA